MSTTIFTRVIDEIRRAILADSWWANQVFVAGKFKACTGEWTQKYIPEYEDVSDYVGTQRKFEDNLNEFIERDFKPRLANLRNAVRDHPDLIFHQLELPQGCCAVAHAGPVRIIIDYLIVIDDYGWRCDVLLGPVARKPNQ